MGRKGTGGGQGVRGVWSGGGGAVLMPRCSNLCICIMFRIRMSDRIVFYTWVTLDNRGKNKYI